LSQSNEIVTLIEHAEERTREAQNALAGAESDARIARDSAQQAQQHAEQASKVALVEMGLVKDGIYDLHVNDYVVSGNKRLFCFLKGRRHDSSRSF